MSQTDLRLEIASTMTNLDLSARAIADLAGVGHMVVVQLVDGKTNPHTTTRLKLRRGLDLLYDYLAAGEDWTAAASHALAAREVRRPMNVPYVPTVSEFLAAEMEAESC